MMCILWRRAAVLILVATPLWAQDVALVGTWYAEEIDEEGELKSRLTFNADGTVLMMAEFRPAADWFEMEEFGEIEFPDFELITIHATGAWTTRGDSLYVQMTAIDMQFGNMGQEEFVLAVVRSLIRYLAAEQGLSEPEFEEFEQSMLPFFLEMFDDAFVEGVDDWTEPAHYVVDRDLLLLTSSDEDEFEETTTEYRRVMTPTAVVGSSWGAIKQQVRER